MEVERNAVGGTLLARRPSAGFLILVAAAASVSAFFAWGLSEPELDRCWRVLQEMKVGRKDRLDSADAALLRRTLERFPGLRPSLLDEKPAGLLSAHTGGWIRTEAAWMLADPEAETDPVAAMTCSIEDATYPVRVALQGAGASQEIDFPGPGRVLVPLSRELRAGGGLIGVLLLSPGGAGGLDSGFQVVFPEGGQ